MSAKTTVRIAEQKIWVGETAIPLLSGEMHYWRMAPESWRAALERARNLGLEVIATYVCWDFHETAPGQFDFYGRTDARRNLAGFLDLLTEMGFWIIIRPGPYIYAEWSNAGVPESAARYHRLDPAYLPLARRYLEAVVPILRPHLATQSGRIILCQAENELDCWPHMYTEPLGLGTQPGLFQEFLAQRYGSIEDLNAAWRSAYPAFEAARAVLTLPPGRAEWMPRYLDYYRFKHWYVVRGIQWTVETLRDLGIDVPIYSNTIQVHSNEPWSAMEAVSDLTGTDLYPSNNFRRSEEHREFLEAARYLRTYSRLPYIAEFEAGVWHGAHVESQVGALQAQHYRLAAISALMAGVVGWNWYMLVNRDNWSMSPINEWGHIRPDLYQVFAQLVALYREIDPPSLEKISPLAVTIDPLQQAASHPACDLTRALYLAGLDYDFFDVNTGQVQRPCLFYAGDQWLSAGGQARLVKYMKAGGHLICLGSAPCLDDGMHPYNALALPDAQGAIGDIGEIGLTLVLAGQAIPIQTRWLEIFNETPGEPIHAVRRSVDENAGEEMQFLCRLPIGTRYTVGFTQARGQGRLTYLGLQPTPELLLGLCQAFAVQPPVRSVTAGVSTAIFHRKGIHNRFYLMMVNTGGEDKAVDVRFAPGLLSGAPQLRNLLDGSILPGIDQCRAFLSLNSKDAAVFEILVSPE